MALLAPKRQKWFDHLWPGEANLPWLVAYEL